MTTSSILGKRTRSAAVPKARVKRQARTVIFSDEQENPFVTGTGHDRCQDGDSMDIDELSEPSLSPAKQSTARSPLSPASKNPRLAGRSQTASKLQNPTPQTPRHKDAFPTAQSTPRHRILVTNTLTPRTPRTPVTPGGSIATVYSQARQLFTRSTEPGRLVGRDAEREELVTFVQDRIAKSSGSCIYVSGPPGTGKSAMVNEITPEFEDSETLKKAYINCMSMKSSKDIYGSLLEAFCEDMEIQEGDEVKKLQNKFTPRRKSKALYIVTLDEIDHILSLDLEILYSLFEWSLHKSSRLILIGIANALDLTDRFLPRLKARDLKPQLLPFLPYTAAQIKNVIITRLKSLIPTGSPTPDYVPFLHPAAIELCSRKVASQTGDLRKAFDICRRAIDVVEADTKQKHWDAVAEQVCLSSPSKQPLQENVNSSSSPIKPATTKSLAKSLGALTVQTAPRASIGHVNKITSSTFGNGASQRLKALNLQQKAALCALLALEKRKRLAVADVMATPSKSNHMAPTVKALYDTYCILCTRESVLHPLTSTEFRDVIGSLETLSLISGIDGRNGSFVGLSTPSRKGKKVFGSGVGSGDEKRVGSCVGEREVAIAVEGLGAGILKSILSGEGFD